MKKLIVKFSGWMECDPEKTEFQYIGGDPVEDFLGGDIHVTCEEYMTLSPEEQSMFVLKCLGQTYIDALDVGLTHCDMEVKASP